MFIEALFIVARHWKQPNCPLMGDSIKKMWYIYTMKYCLTMKKDEILPFVTTWIKREGIMVSRIKS